MAQPQPLTGQYLRERLPAVRERRPSRLTPRTLGSQSVTATVNVGGLDPSCNATASCTTGVKPPPEPARKFDEYGNIRFNDEKARLDNYAIQLQNEPGSTGVIIVYGSCEGEAQQRGDRAKDYLVNTRGIEAGRITVIDGGCRSDLTVQLWIVPSGCDTTRSRGRGYCLAVSGMQARSTSTAPAQRRRGIKNRLGLAKPLPIGRCSQSIARLLFGPQKGTKDTK